MSMKSDPKYDTDLVNLGYLKKIINELKEINSTTQNNLEKVFSKNYGSQPTTPYYSGSTWTTEDYIYRCIKDRLIGPFSIDDWVIIYDRKKEKLMNENFLFLSQVELKEQSDGYIETYYLVDDPSASWDTSLLKSAHEGDFWRTKNETGFCDYVYTKLTTNPVSYDWLITNLPITVFNAVTGTKRIYLVEPNNYSAGDLWQKIENNKKVYYESLKDSETFNSEDWKIINEELSLKNLESYYIITSEINKELETIELNIKKKIVESSDSILVAVESGYTKKETTELLTKKVDANGDSIEAIYGDRTIEIPIKTLSELTIGQTEIQTSVGEVSVKTSDLEKSIEYFAVELEMYNFNVPTDSEGYVLENSAYTIKHYAYYKGQQVEVTPVLKNNINGFNIVVTSSNIQIDTTKGTKIDELNNILEFSFIYKDGDQENILIKKVSVSLALQGKTGATGQDGKDGSGVNILGSFETFEALQQAQPTGSTGDAYLIQGNLYVWNGSSWENVGNIQGPKGDKGDPGEQGLRGLQGPQGEQGIAGKDGTDGKTTYFHIKYSDVENPTNSSQLLELPGDYIGTYIDFEEEDSNNPQDYTWSRFKGIQGETGEQGIPGQNGENGLTSYLHIKYSNDGLTFTENNGETPGDYIGQYTDFQKDDSINFDSYKWTKIKGQIGPQGPQGEQGLRGLQGPQGEQGIAGKDGTDGKTTYFHIKYSDVEIPTNSSQLLELPGDYIGTYIDFEKEDSNNPQDYTWSRFKGIQGETGEQGIPGQNGENGLTSYLHIKYSNDGSTFTENNGETPGDYIGQYTDFKKDDSVDFDSYKWTKIKGQIGPQGPQGEQGEKGDTGPQGIQGVAGKDGTSTYFYIKYSENSSGNPMYDAPTDKTMYMGVASTTSDTAPISYSAYTWFKTQGETGPQGIPGQTGSDGQTSYLHIKYSNDGLNFTANNGEEIGRWQGTYVDFQETDSLEFSDYKWVDTAIVVNEQINDLNDKIDDTNINLKENYTNNKDLEQKIEDAKSTVVTEMQTIITQTKESWEANVIKKINADGVETLKNNLVIIDIEGIKVATNTSKISTLMSHKSFEINNSSGGRVAFFGYDETEKKSKAEMDNLTIKNYLTTGYHRTEGFITEEGEKRTGIFYIGG